MLGARTGPRHPRAEAAGLAPARLALLLFPLLAVDGRIHLGGAAVPGRDEAAEGRVVGAGHGTERVGFVGDEFGHGTKYKRRSVRP